MSQRQGLSFEKLRQRDLKSLKRSQEVILFFETNIIKFCFFSRSRKKINDYAGKKQKSFFRGIIKL
ncbi:MAG: hypothetical protein IJT82_05505, partial [Schwartzia sp.]|nr:hypothetical protein [Schwartzia sp. (in: firmicutes)]